MPEAHAVQEQELAMIGQNLGAATMEGSTLVFDMVRKTAVGHDIGYYQGHGHERLGRACLQEQELAVSGRNWGAAAVEGSTLVFTVGSKPAFRVPLKDVGGVQQAAQEARSLCGSLSPKAVHTQPKYNPVMGVGCSSRLRGGRALSSESLGCNPSSGVFGALNTILGAWNSLSYGPWLM